MGEPNSGRRTRALGTRGSVVSYLAANGDITDPKGMASTALAEAVGYPGSSAAFAQLLSGMERSGLIEREIRGKRTYRIAATAPALRGRPSGSRRPGPVGPAAAASRRGQPAPDGDAAGHDLGRDLAAAAGGGTGFDYDELARRLLVQLVRRLTVSPESPLPGEAPGPANTVPLNTVPANPGQVNAGQANPVYGGPADADPGSASPEPASPVPADPAPADPAPADPGMHDAALRQTVASLEQRLASVQSRQRKLTAENARLREQLQAAQQSLAQAEERGIAGQLGSAEVLLLERLLSASREQAGQQEEAGAG